MGGTAPWGALTRVRGALKCQGGRRGALKAQGGGRELWEVKGLYRVKFLFLLSLDSGDVILASLISMSPNSRFAVRVHKVFSRVTSTHGFTTIWTHMCSFFGSWRISVQFIFRTIRCIVTCSALTGCFRSATTRGQCKRKLGHRNAQNHVSMYLSLKILARVISWTSDV